MTVSADAPTRLYRAGPRVLSFVAAAAWSALVLVYPQALAPDGRVPYGWLLLLMWGMVAGFVHGVGYVPTNPLARVVLGPFIAWALLGGVTAWFVWHLQPGDPAT